ncbi:TPA: HlyD family efflux transporter periplasmic adaptor subunit [Stenotrophomonas maltophilia]|nr:HlyD family efflux transporter periplasmic adaptor subunit [Stenotrophomonas maltophilia]
MSRHLFRREVMQAKGNRWLGRINMVQPIPLWLFTAFAACSAVSVILFIALGSYTKRARAMGQLVPVEGMSTVMAPASGVVSLLKVSEGENVRAGQVVAVLTVPRATVGEGDTSVALEKRIRERVQGLKDVQAADQSQLDAQSDGLIAQVAAAQRELAQFKEEIQTRSRQVVLAEETLSRLERLREGSYVSELQIKQQQTLALEQHASVQALQRQAITTQRLIAQLQEAMRSLPQKREATRAGLRGALAQLEQEHVELLARGELVLTAPVDGTVVTQVLKPGQSVTMGQPLLSILPQDGRLEAGLLVPSRVIGFIDPGDRVLLRYQAYPYQKFGHHEGTVQRVSRSALTGTELEMLMPGSTIQGEPMYRVTVALSSQEMDAYGRIERLKPGMTLEADILGERSSLAEWIFAPLVARSKRIF